MKKLVMKGMFAVLLVSGTAVHAEDVRPASDDQTASGESVDCFYEHNQSNSLCQETEKAEHSKLARAVEMGAPSSTKTTR